MRITLRSFTVFAYLLIALVARATIGSGLQMQLGNPSSATTDPANKPNFLLDRAHMALAYNDTTRDPNWVSWDLTTADVGTVDRSDFIPDPDLPAGFHAVTTQEYNGVGVVRIDRGHMSPSKDRTITPADNQVVFYMTNIVPQASDNNQGPWAVFEEECRTIASLGNELLIVSGPSGFSSATIPSGVAFVPAFTWKIVVVVPNGPGTALSRITSASRVIALKLPNVNGIRNVPWTDFITSASEIEADTGYNLFSALPTSLANVLRVKIDGGGSTPGLPTIFTSPSSQTTVVGGSANFSVAASGGALTYQWHKDGDDIAGATSPALALTNVLADAAGTYDVLVSNSAGSVLSAPAILTVSTPAAPVITTQPVSKTVLAGGTATFTAAASGVPSPTFQWFKDVTTLVATGATLTLTNVQAADAANYYVVATNQAGFATSDTVTLTVTPIAPSITTHPVSQAVVVGNDTTLSVVAAGSAPLTYQWRKNGTPISGATFASLSLTNVQAGDVGSYDVLVTNAAGSAASNLAVISVAAPGTGSIYWDFGSVTVPTAAPTTNSLTGVVVGDITNGNNFPATPPAVLAINSLSSGYPGASAGANVQAAIRAGATVNLNVGATGSTFFQFTVTPPAGKTLVVTGISFGSRSTGTGPKALSVRSSADGFASSLLTFTALANSNYAFFPSAAQPAALTPLAVASPTTFRIYGYDGTAASSATNWRVDDLTLTGYTSTGGAVPLTVAVASTSPAANATNVAVIAPVTVTFNTAVTPTGNWFTLTSAATGPVAATISPASGSATSFTLTPAVPFANSDTLTATILASQLSDTATHTATLSSNYTFSFKAIAPTAPAITTAPRSQTVTVGGTAAFSVVATGTAPLAYAWFKGTTLLSNDPGHISGATSATLTIANVAFADAGNDYHVVITNPANVPVASAPVALVVSATPVAPSIVTPPVAQTISAGGTATFTVIADGSTPLAYQWRKDGAPLANGPGIAGATSDTLTLTGVAIGQAGSYDVVVTNGTLPDATSAAATLTVNSAGGLSFSYYTGGYTTQNFDSLPTSGTFAFTSAGPFGIDVPLANGGVGATAAPGWSFVRYDGSNANAAFRVDTGSSASGGAISYGLGGSTDRALGALGSGSNESRLGVMLVNQTGAPITQFTVRYAGEQWRHAGQATPNKLTFSYAVGATDINTGTFTDVAALDFTAPIATATTGALNGNLDANRTSVLAQVTGLTWNPGQVLVLRWTDVDDPSTDDGLAIDDFVFTTGTLAAPAVTLQPASQSVTFGDAVTLSVAATGTPAPTYQWRKNGVNIAGATSASLVFAPVAVADQGSYTCVVTNLAGSVTSNIATVAVAKAPASVLLDNLAPIYNGTPRVVTATTAPAGLAVALTYDGLTTPPTAAGSYTVTGTINDANYAGNATATLVVGKAPAAVTLDNLLQTYTGASLAVSATTAPAGLAVDLTYNGNTTAPIGAGSYPVIATINDSNFTGSAAGTLVIARAPASVSLANLAQTYDGSPRIVTAATSPAGLGVAFAYEGSSIAPTDAGSYHVVASITDPNYIGANSGTLVVGKALATIVLSGLSQTYDGSAKVVAAATTPAGLATSIAYNGAAAAPINAGSYPVSVTINSVNYAGNATGTLTVAKAAATVALSDLIQTYDGSPKSVTVATTPAALATAVTYDGSATTPTGAGSYLATAIITDPNYTGSATGTFAVQKQSASVALANLSQTYDGTPKAATATTTPAGLTVLITYDGSSTAPTAAASYAVVATIQDNNRFGVATGTLVIAKANATIALGALTQAYDGTPRVVTATTSPAGLAVNITYAGSATPPVYPGSYAVVATVTDSNNSASATGTLVVSTTALSRHAPNLNGDLTGSLQVLLPESFALNGSALVSGDILVPGTPTVQLNGHPTFVGTQNATGSAAPANYQVTLNGNAVLRYLVRRVDAIAMPVVAAPPAPAGTRNVSVNSGQPPAIGDFATLRNLTLNGNVGDIAVPAGTYGSFTANGGSSFVLGVAGATTPSVYNLQGLTINGNAQLKIVGPVILTLANGTSFNGHAGAAAHSEWLTLRVASGSFTLNGNVDFHGAVIAPSGTVTINGNSTLEGSVVADRLTINGNGELRAVGP